MNGNGTGRALGEHHLDFDFHGVVGVRLVNALPREAAAVGGQLGGMAQPLARNPDITVRFVPKFSAAGLRYVELGRSGFTDDAFLILWHRKRPVRVQLPFVETESGYEVICEHGLSSIPHLEALVKLVALRKGFAPVHASGFEYDGAGVLVSGWAHGGKTSSLLAFADAGARFVSDDLVLLSADGSKMAGLPTPISISDWQLSQLPRVRNRVTRTRRAFFDGVRRLESLEPRLGGGVVARAVRDALPALQRRLKVRLPPETVFGPVGSCTAVPGTVFLAQSHAVEEIQVERTDAGKMAEQLAASVQFELLPYLGQYLAYRFAFPGRRSTLLESIETAASTILHSALARTATYVVRHPHPVSLAQLYQAMAPYISRASTLAARV